MNRRDLLTKSGAAVLVASTGLSIPAQAGVPSFDPTGAKEWTQIANNVQLLGIGISDAQAAYGAIQGIAQRALQIQHQFNQYQTMLDNLRDLPTRFWRNIVSDFTTLEQGYDTQLGLSWTRADFDDALRARLTPFEQYEANPLNTQQFSAKYRTISRDTQVTAEDILIAANMSVETIQDEITSMRETMRQSQTVKGNAELLKVGHDIAQKQYANGLKLRNLMADNNKALIAFKTHALEIDNMERATRDRFFTDNIDGTPSTPATTP